MVCTKSEFGATQVRPELDTHGYCGQHLSFGGAVTALKGTESATTVSDHVLNVVMDLAQYTAQAKITGIRIKNILSGLSGKSEDWRMYECVPENTKGRRTARIPHEWNIFPSQGHQRCSDVSKFRDESPVVSYKSQELAYTLEAIWNRP